MAAQPATKRARCLRLPRAAARRACSSPSSQVTAGVVGGSVITVLDMVLPRRVPTESGLLEVGGEGRVLDVLLDEAGLPHQVEDLRLAVGPLLVDVGAVDEPVELVRQPVLQEGHLLRVPDGEVLRVGRDDLVAVLLPLLDPAVPELDEERRLLGVDRKSVV